MYQNNGRTKSVRGNLTQVRGPNKRAVQRLEKKKKEKHFGACEK